MFVCCSDDGAGQGNPGQMERDMSPEPVSDDAKRFECEYLVTIKDIRRPYSFFMGTRVLFHIFVVYLQPSIFLFFIHFFIHF